MTPSEAHGILVARLDPDALSEDVEAVEALQVLGLLSDDAHFADRFPLEAVEGAVRALLEHDGRTVVGWVLAADMQRLDPDAPPEATGLEQSLDYAVSAGTSSAHALGLLEALGEKLRRLTRRAFVDEE